MKKMLKITATGTNLTTILILSYLKDLSMSYIAKSLDLTSLSSLLCVPALLPLLSTSAICLTYLLCSYYY